MKTILVTGATGKIGAEVVQQLQAQGHAVRAATRKPPADAQGGVEYARFDFAEPDTFAPALRDVSRVFLMRPPDITDTKRYINPFIAAAKEAGVEQIVFMSLLGVEKNRVVPHRAVEDYLREAGVPWTFLRPSFFMQNLSTTHRDDIRLHNDIFVPAGHGKTSFIDARDIAAVAAKTLTEDGHAYKAYPLSGNESLDYDEIAAIFSDVLGRKIVYPNPSILQFIRRWRLRKESWSFIFVMVGIYTVARLGLADAVTPDTEQLLGRPPITVRQFVEDYQACWTKEGTS